MKKHILFLAILVVISAASMASVQAAIKANVMVSSFMVTDGTAAPGKNFTLSVKLTNPEPGTCAENIVASLQAGYPFIINGVSSQTAGELCTNANRTVDFPVRIDPGAAGGTYQLVVTADYETPTLTQFSNSNTINLLVEGTPEIKASIINSNPLDVYAGDTATVTVNIENAGSFQAQSVTASISADSPVDVNWAKSSASIGLLDSKQSKTADFSIEVPKNAEAKDYKLYITVQYNDENLAPQKKDFTFVLPVKKKALFETSDGSEVLYQNENSRTVNLVLKNTGTDNAYKIKAKLLPQFPFSTDGSVKYIDSLEPGQSTPIQLTINTDKDATPGKYGLDLLLDFEDGQGKDMQDTATVMFTVQEKPFFTKVFSDYWFLWMIILVIAILALRKRIKRKKKAKN